MKKLTISSLVVVASVLVAACGSDSTTSSSGSTGTSGTSGGTSGTSGTSGSTGTTTSVDVTSNKFTPATVTVKVGDKVVWNFKGGSHDVVSGNNCTDDGKFKSTLQTSGSYEFTFTTAGTYPYYCTPHCSSANMVGSVIVQ